MQNTKILLLFLSILLTLGACNPSQSLKSVTDLYDGSKIESDPAIDKMLAPYKKDLMQEMNQEIGTASQQLLKERPESALGNFVADAILETARGLYDKEIHFGLPNYGGLRVPYLNEGAITKGEIFELMPFDNLLVVLTIDGKMVEKLFTHIIIKEGWPLSKGVKIEADTINNQHRFFINEEEVKPNETYRFCVSDYIANGGDDCDFLKDQQRDELDILFRDAIMEYVKKQKSIDANIEGRFIYSSR